MTALLSVISIALPLALGFAIVMALWPRHATAQEILSAKALQLALSLGIGCGVCSALLLAWLVVAGRPGRAIVPIQFTAVVAAGWAALRRRAFARVTPNNTMSVGPGGGMPLQGKVSRPLLWAASVVLGLAALGVAVRVFTAPHGDWDAWASWNMKARMIYLGGDHWRDVFSGLLPDAVPEYPLLLPLSVVALWLTLGSPAAIAPALLAAAFASATVLTLGAGLSILRSKSQGLLATAVLAATPFFIIHGASQYADVPVAFFFLGTLVLLALYDREPDIRLLILAGLTAGLAAWTKNEGFVFLVAVAASRLIFARRHALLWYLAGAAPPMILFACLKIFLASASNQMVAGQGLHTTLNRLADAARYRIVGIAFLAEFAHLGNWPVSILLLLLLYAVVQGFCDKEDGGHRLRPLAAILILTLAAYFLFYLVTPFDLQFHLQVSLDRLIVQLWPSTLFVYFLTVRSPEESRPASGFNIWRKKLMPFAPALILFAGAWASGATLVSLWKTRGLPYETNMMAYERKLSGMRSVLPDRGVIGYTTDDGPLREFFWTQYFLAPLIVVRSGEPELVVLNRHNADAAEPRDQSYAVEEHYGMKLYDFGTGIYLEDRRAMQR